MDSSLSSWVVAMDPFSGSARGALERLLVAVDDAGEHRQLGLGELEGLVRHLLAHAVHLVEDPARLHHRHVVLHPGWSVIRPYVPNASALPRYAAPGVRPFCIFRYFCRAG